MIDQTDPIQPFWVLESEKYYKKTSSVPAIAHFYKFHGSDGISDSYAVPDGAIDIIIDCDPDRLSARICGPVGHGSTPGFKSGETYFGIRLLPEALVKLGDASVAELAGREYDLRDLLHGSSLIEQIFEEPDFRKQTAIFEQYFLEHQDPETSIKNGAAPDDTVPAPPLLQSPIASSAWAHALSRASRHQSKSSFVAQ